MHGHQRERVAPFVIPRDEIPAQTSEVRDLSVRPFTAHERLGGAVPSSTVSMAWLSVRSGQSTALRSHAEKSLLIVLQGSAELFGSSTRGIEHGDVVTLPANHEYGFRKVGGPGLQVLHVLFKAEPEVSVGEVSSLEQLLRRNEERARTTMANPYFKMLQTGALQTEEARGLFRDYARVFCDAFQTFLFTRQATCRADEFRNTFGEHLREELGHNQLMKLTGESRRFDAVLEATSSWFSHQMLLQDNAGKAVIHLVLETGGDYFHNLAKPTFEHDDSAAYFETHAEDDARHKQMGIRLLEGHHPTTYARLHTVLDDAWDMLDALTRRIEHLVGLGRTAS